MCHPVFFLCLGWHKLAVKKTNDTISSHTLQVTPGSFERHTAIPSIHEPHRAHVTAPGPPLTVCYSERQSVPSSLPPPNSVSFPPHHATPSFIILHKSFNFSGPQFSWLENEGGKHTIKTSQKDLKEHQSLRYLGVKCFVVVLCLRKTKCLSPLLETYDGYQQGKGCKKFCNKENHLMLLRPAFPECMWLTGTFHVWLVGDCLLFWSLPLPLLPLLQSDQPQTHNPSQSQGLWPAGPLPRQPVSPKRPSLTATLFLGPTWCPSLQSPHPCLQWHDALAASCTRIEASGAQDWSSALL